MVKYDNAHETILQTIHCHPFLRAPANDVVHGFSIFKTAVNVKQIRSNSKQVRDCLPSWQSTWRACKRMQCFFNCNVPMNRQGVYEIQSLIQEGWRGHKFLHF